MISDSPRLPMGCDAQGRSTQWALKTPLGRRFRRGGGARGGHRLWLGRTPAATRSSTVAIREFNDHVAARTDCEAVILSVGDGLMCLRPTR
jgi:hypothetical protein